MIPAQPIIEEYFDALDARSGDDRKKALRTFNTAYFDIAQATSWSEMRKSVTISHGQRLPANMIGIDAVYDADGNFYEGREKSAAAAGASDPMRRFYTTPDTTAPLVRGTGITARKGQTTVSFATTPSDPTGEYVTIQGSSGFYKFTSATEITPAFRDDNVSVVAFEIRPRGTMTLGVIGSDGQPYTSPVTVDLWVFPDPISSDQDVILLPSSEALMLRAMRRFYKVTKKDLPRAMSLNDDYNAALAEALSRNRIYVAPSLPKDLRGMTTGFAASPR